MALLNETCIVWPVAEARDTLLHNVDTSGTLIKKPELFLLANGPVPYVSCIVWPVAETGDRRLHSVAVDAISGTLIQSFNCFLYAYSLECFIHYHVCIVLKSAALFCLEQTPACDCQAIFVWKYNTFLNLL